MRFKRITIDPKQMAGVPCIRHLRIPVATVLGMIKEGMTVKEILSFYPSLKAADIHAAIDYADALIAKKRANEPRETFEKVKEVLRKKKRLS